MHGRCEFSWLTVQSVRRLLALGFNSVHNDVLTLTVNNVLLINFLACEARTVRCHPSQIILVLCQNQNSELSRVLLYFLIEQAAEEDVLVIHDR